MKKYFTLLGIQVCVCVWRGWKPSRGCCYVCVGSSSVHWWYPVLFHCCDLDSPSSCTSRDSSSSNNRNSQIVRWKVLEALCNPLFLMNSTIPLFKKKCSFSLCPLKWLLCCFVDINKCDWQYLAFEINMLTLLKVEDMHLVSFLDKHTFIFANPI